MSLNWAGLNNSQQDIKLQFSGSNIQIIKDKTGAFVYVDKENVSAQYAGRCIIRGNSVQVLAAEKRVHELLARRDMMLMDNGGQKTGKKSGPNEKHDSSPDSSQVPPKNALILGGYFFKWRLDSYFSRKTGKRYRPNSFCNWIFSKFVLH